jgi:hypothetical protein
MSDDSLGIITLISPLPVVPFSAGAWAVALNDAWPKARILNGYTIHRFGVMT